MVDRFLSLLTDRIHELPVLVLMPHSRCNCRCIMCDIWKANQEKRELSIEVLQRNRDTLRNLRVREVTLSGGEALMHSNLWRFCEELKASGIRITLLSTGLLLSAHAKEIITYCDEVIVSLDGDRETHNSIRNLPTAFEKLEAGVAALKLLQFDFPVSGRCVLQRTNFRELNAIVSESKRMGLDRISFLTADVSSTAFNHPSGWVNENVSNIALSSEQADEFETIVRESFVSLQREYASGFIAEGPEKMLKLVDYYRAVLGQRAFSGQRCNAPWVSAVVESNGDVMPCFFHAPYGNIADGSIESVINSPRAVEFRKKLDMRNDPICKKCVCSLYKSPWTD